jgi:hypothetical protein
LVHQVQHFPQGTEILRTCLVSAEVPRQNVGEVGSQLHVT